MDLRCKKSDSEEGLEEVPSPRSTRAEDVAYTNPIMCNRSTSISPPPVVPAPRKRKRLIGPSNTSQQQFPQQPLAMQPPDFIPPNQETEYHPYEGIPRKHTRDIGCNNNSNNNCDTVTGNQFIMEEQQFFQPVPGPSTSSGCTPAMYSRRCITVTNVNLEDPTYREQKLREKELREKQIREQKLREEQFRKQQQLKEQLLREHQIREQLLREQQLQEQQVLVHYLRIQHLKDQQMLKLLQEQELGLQDLLEQQKKLQQQIIQDQQELLQHREHAKMERQRQELFQQGQHRGHASMYGDQYCPGCKQWHSRH